MRSKVAARVRSTSSLKTTTAPESSGHVSAMFASQPHFSYAQPDGGVTALGPWNLPGTSEDEPSQPRKGLRSHLSSSPKRAWFLHLEMQVIVCRDMRSLNTTSEMGSTLTLVDVIYDFGRLQLLQSARHEQ